MKRVVLLLFLIVCSVSLKAQQGDFLRQLSIGSPNGGFVVVRLDNLAAGAVMAAGQPAKTQGYRVCIFSDNSQTARGAANTALAQLHQLYEGVSGDVSYTNPFFKVYAGYCLTRTEATILYGRLKYTFPKAFIVGEQLPITIFGEVAAEEPVEAEKVVE